MSNPIFSYTNKDFDSLLEEARQNVPTLTDEWTDFNDDDIGWVLTKVGCGIGDMLAFHQDRQMLERFFRTVREPKNIIRLLDGLGSRLRDYYPAMTTIRFGIPTSLPGVLLIPKRTVVSGGSGESERQFSTLEDAYIQPGETYVDVPVIQGTWKTQTFTGTGDAKQRYDLPEGDLIAEGYLEVWVDGEQWERADNWYDADGTSKRFLAKSNDTGRMRIYFGDGEYGAEPGLNQTIQVVYATTLGANGNLGKNRATTIKDTIYYEGSPTTVTATNIELARGGAGRETIPEARERVPGFLGTGNRLVSPPDYYYHLKRIKSVAKFALLDRNDCTGMRYLFGAVVIAPAGGGETPSALRNAVHALLRPLAVHGLEVAIYGIKYRTEPVVLEFQTQGDPATTRAAIISRLQSVFGFDSLAIGQSVSRSQIIAEAQGVADVTSVNLIAPAADVTIGLGEMFQLGALTVNQKPSGSGV